MTRARLALVAGAMLLACGQRPSGVLRPGGLAEGGTGDETPVGGGGAGGTGGSAGSGGTGGSGTGGGAAGASGPVLEAPGLVDFGSLPVGKKASRTVTLRSSGGAPLHLEQEELLSDPFRGGLPCTAGGCDILPGGRIDFTIDFEPSAAGEYEHDLVLHGDYAGAPLTIRVRGIGYHRGLRCGLSGAPLDFGTPVSGTTRTRTVTCSNGDETAEAVTLDLDLSGPDAKSFQMAPTSLSIPPKSARDVDLTLHTDGLVGGDVYAQLGIRVRGDHLFLTPVLLTARVLEAALLVDPAPGTGCMAFEARVGTDAATYVTLLNVSDEPVSIERFELGPDSDASFSLEVPGPIDLPAYDPKAPERSAVGGQLVFRPVREGRHAGSLLVVSTDPGLPKREICLTGDGVAER